MQHACSHYIAFCSITWQTRLCLRTWQQNITTAICNKRFQTTPHPKKLEATVTLRHKEKTSERPQPHPPHTRAALHRRLQSLDTEKHKGFVLRLPPQNQPHAKCMQPLQSALQHSAANPLVSTHIAAVDFKNHATIPCTAICNSRFQTNL